MKKVLSLLLCILCVFTVVACGSKEEVSLKKDEFTVEYGKKLSMKPETYLDTKDKELLDSAKVKFEKEKNEKDKNYPQVGAYIGEISYVEDGKDKTKKLVVRVKDTKKPVFEDFQESIQIEKGSSDVDLKKYFFAKDLSDVTIKVDSSNVKFGTVGEYTITVTATDKHKNKATRKSKVIIFENVKQHEEPAKTTPAPTYACPNALYDKNKECGFIPEDKYLPAPNINFKSEEERTKYIADNGLEDVWTGYYTVKNNGKEDVKIWYLNPNKEEEQKDEN